MTAENDTRKQETASSTPWTPRSLEQLTPEERADLERELDSGVTELPPNQIRGILGEKGPSLYKVDEFAPDLNAGLSQEGDAPVRSLAILLAYLLFFPLAFWLVWRSPYSERSKILVSVVMAIGVVAVAVLLARA